MKYHFNTVDESIKQVSGFKDHPSKYNDNRVEKTQQLSRIVNNNIPKVNTIHLQEHENILKKEGYIVFDDFLSQEEISNIREYLHSQKGYNAHVPSHSDKIARIASPDYPFDTLSYTGDLLLNYSPLLNKLNHPYLISLAQSYIGCFPTLYSINSWWHYYRGEQKYSTQNTHRDHDDYRFLAFFVYLSDIDENNGPHVFYPRTQDGSFDYYEDMELDNETVITGKAGTAVLADSFALHRGQPLKKGARLLCWWRYGLHLNDTYFWDKNDNYKVNYDTIFNHIPSNINNEYLFRGFIK